MIMKINTKKRRLLTLLILFLILTPVGLLTDNPAWGEWGIDYFRRTLGFVPHGIQNGSGIFQAPFKDYTIFQNSLTNQILSALIAAVIIWLFFKTFLYLKKQKERN